MILRQTAVENAVTAVPQTNLITWLFILGVVALVPFLLTMITSFAKIVVVGGIVRQALGTQQLPPNSVITGLALILTIHIMAPVALISLRNYGRQAESHRLALSALVPVDPNEAVAFADEIRHLYEPEARFMQSANAISRPLGDFLKRHAARSNVQLFKQLRQRLFLALPESSRPANWNDFFPDDRNTRRYVDLAVIYVPAFVLTELTEAFQIGFLIFVPFLIIDLVVSNILMAMGMQMLSPTTISLPLKLLLFVLVDGWRLILQGLVLGYVQ
ncbi:MAG: EscR/YscR/HrcR family type III secretion system export apparatus protein [Planctomycetes bacterium]|nr:EscR/YscR/HrcR family type III secretion system export apparatus protein [Planctomycetota bacterium]